jgi:protocatechuate 3,4-dioxygenase beta subunit
VFILLCVTAAWGQRGGGGTGAGAQGAGGRNQGGGAAGTGGQPLASTQMVTDPKLLCTLEGSVLNASTGEPVQRATLTLVGSGLQGNLGGGRGGGGGRSARTDNEGKFKFESVQPGTYRLSADRVGFLRQQYGAQTPGGSGAPVNLAQSQTVRNLDIKLTPQGVILGTVFDDEGDPLPRATVAAYRMGKATSMTSARRGGQQTGGTANTNDIGQYRIAGLPPGDYAVIASGQSGRAGGGRGGMGGFAGAPGGRGRAAAAAAVEEDLLPTYYPSSLDAAAAAPVEVSPGQEMAGVNIALRKGRLYQVQGKVAGVTAQDAGGVRVNLLPREGGAASMFMGGGAAGAVRADGSFQVARVQPGSYYLIAQSMGGGGRGGGRGGMGGPGAGPVGRTTVDVGSSDVTNILITMVDPVPVTGTVKVEGQQAQSTQSQTMSLSLTPVEYIPGLPGGGATARVSQGAFKMAAVTPDNYYVVFGGLPEGSYVKSVRMNGQEAIEKGIDLTSARGAVVLDVTLSTNGGSVEGTVVEDGKAAPGSYLMLLADPIRPGQPYLNRSSTSDQDGKFTIKGLAPGDYKLYAFEESQPEIAQDLTLIKPFESKAAKVKVSESSTERAELKVLKPGDANK